MRLIPREEKFFTHFNNQAKLIVTAAHSLHQAAQQGNSAVEKAAAEIASLEQRGDDIIHEIFRCLNQTFITPIDPEDIHSLASHLDDVLDGLEDSAHRLVAYHIDPIPPMMIELTSLIKDCALSLQSAFSALEKDKPLLDHCIEINRFEDTADQLVRRAIARLFAEEKDPIQLIKQKEVYEFLELTTDYFEDVADALQNVVVKNS